jgi:hypothetical protein
MAAPVETTPISFRAWRRFGRKLQLPMFYRSLVREENRRAGSLLFVAGRLLCRREVRESRVDGRLGVTETAGQHDSGGKRANRGNGDLGPPRLPLHCHSSESVLSDKILESGLSVEPECFVSRNRAVPVGGRSRSAAIVFFPVQPMNA